MAILVLHGGAGSIQAEDEAAYVRGLRRAADAGYAVLERGGGAITAVLAAVEEMEGNAEAFNAGVGGALTNDGRVELDACVMGSDGSVGAVACVGTSVHPVRLAERVRRESPHVLLVATGAEALERDPVPNAALVTERSRAQLARWRERAQAARGASATGTDHAVDEGRAGEPDGGAQDTLGPAPSGSGTVGAVALDDTGFLAAATSTGGVVGQWPGRVGDAPIPGAGTYAGPFAALSCTGKGEAFLRAVTARTVALAIERGVPLARALRDALTDVERMGGAGGLIVVDRHGRFGFAYDTPSMAYALRAPGVREEAVGRQAEVRVMTP